MNAIFKDGLLSYVFFTAKLKKILIKRLYAVVFNQIKALNKLS